jgi:hypothetical protein
VAVAAAAARGGWRTHFLGLVRPSRNCAHQKSGRTPPKNLE